MFPRLWNLIGDQWLISKAAVRIFAIAASLAVVVPALVYLDMVRDTGALSQVFWATAGVLTALSIFFLWSGMWRFWNKFDQSSRVARRIWFLVVLFGFWYGTVLYFIFVYLRQSSRALSFENGVDTP